MNGGCLRAGQQWHCAKREHTCAWQTLHRLHVRPALFRNVSLPSRRDSRRTRVLTHSIDRSMIAFAALTSQGLTQNAPQYVVSGTAMRGRIIRCCTPCLSYQEHIFETLPVKHRCMQGAGSETDSRGVERLPLRRGGWNFWDWEGRKIHYITAGQLQAPLLL